MSDNSTNYKFYNTTALKIIQSFYCLTFKLFNFKGRKAEFITINKTSVS